MVPAGKVSSGVVLVLAGTIAISEVVLDGSAAGVPGAGAGTTGGAAAGAGVEGAGIGVSGVRSAAPTTGAGVGAAVVVFVAAIG